MDIRSSLRFERGIKKIRVSVRLKHPLWSKAESKAWSKTQTNPGLKSQKTKLANCAKLDKVFLWVHSEMIDHSSYPQVGKGKGPRVLTNPPFSVDFGRHLSFHTYKVPLTIKTGHKDTKVKLFC